MKKSIILVVLVSLSIYILSLPILAGDLSEGYYAFIPNADDGTISVFDSDENKVVRTIKVGKKVAHGIAITPDGDSLYTGVMNSDELIVLNPLTGEKMTTIEVTKPLHGIDMSSDGKYLVIGQVPKVIDTEKNEIVAKFDLPGNLAKLAHLRFSSDGKKVYMGARPDGNGGFNNPETSVIVGNMSNFSVEASWPLRAAYTSASSNNGKYIYTVNYLSDFATLSVLDASNGVLLKQKLTGINAHGLAVAPDDRYIWVASRGAKGKGGGIFIFDADNNWEQVKKVDLPLANHVAFSPDGEKVFVTDRGGNLTIFDASSFYQLRKIKLGKDPHEISFLSKNK